MTPWGRTSGTLGAYTFDARNRLTSAGGSSYTYNPDGFRVGITGTGAATFVVDPNAALPRVLSRTKGGVTTYYVYGLGLLYEVTGTSAKQYVFDHIGNTVAMIDDSQSVSDRWTYGPYGTVISHTGSTDTPFQFNGALGIQTDPNGLCYMRARYYNPRLMRFVNGDPIKFDGGLNWYEFASDAPISRADPSGRFDGDVPGSRDWYAPPGGWQKPNGAPDPVGNVIMGTFTAAVTAPVWVPIVATGVINAPDIAAASGRFVLKAAANPAVQRGVLIGTAIAAAAREYTETEGGEPAVEASAETVENLGVESAKAITQLSGYMGELGGKLQEDFESLFGESATNTSEPPTGGRTSDGGRS